MSNSELLVHSAMQAVDDFFLGLSDMREGELGRNDPTSAFLKVLCNPDNPQYLEVRHEIGKAKVDGVEVPIYDKL